MQTVSIEVTDQNDLQLLLLLVERLGLKIVKNPADKKDISAVSTLKNNVTFVVEEPESDLEYHRKIIKAGTDMSEERMQEMLAWRDLPL
jgi:hypothetical protein